MSSREKILDVLTDMVSDLLYYDRKEDSSLPVGSIEEAVKQGEITLDEMLAHVRQQMTGSFQ
jgi:hypothetical protein